MKQTQAPAAPTGSPCPLQARPLAEAGSDSSARLQSPSPPAMAKDWLHLAAFDQHLLFVQAAHLCQYCECSLSMRPMSH